MIPQGKGFYYSVSQEAIADWRSLSVWDKLNWLREANDFIDKFAPQKAKKLQEQFRSGKI
jgi:hypothetical protein